MNGIRPSRDTLVGRSAGDRSTILAQRLGGERRRPLLLLRLDAREEYIPK
jgi:hypothetical protein